MLRHFSTDHELAAYAATILRVSLGIVFIAHALSKPLLFTFAGSVEFFESNGFPGSSVYPVFFAELIGGALLLAGVMTRWVAALLIPVTLGALLVHAGNGWLFSSPGGGWEFPAFLAITLVVQLLLGDGAIALPLITPCRKRKLIDAS